VLKRFFGLNRSAERTRQTFFGRLRGLLHSAKIDDDLWDELETIMLQADVGVATTQELLDNLRARVRQGRVRDGDELYVALEDELHALLEESAAEARPLLPSPVLNALLIVGVNGVGKTTSIAKLGAYLRDQGHRVILAAGDTFRAAAIDQLRLWGERTNLPVVAHQPGADPSSVVYDALAAAKARGADVVIIDTAGRLHTKFNLMEELKKVRRVMDKQGVDAVSTLLVLDATTGQNAVSQARQFSEAVGLDGLIIAKLDGTARGGVVFAIARELDAPVRFIGTGERVEDLSEFDADAFVKALLDGDNGSVEEPRR
jgi:fused signal recognition particle receptor